MKLKMKNSYVFVLVLIILINLNDSSSSSAKPNNGIKIRHLCDVDEEEKQMTTFDFRKISNNNFSDYEIKTNNIEETVNFQLCSPLSENCNGQKNYSVCLKKKDEEIGIGKYPPKVVFKNFQIAFQFTGDKCNETANYTTLIFMQCDYNAIGNNSYPTKIPNKNKNNECEIYLNWATAAACGEESKVDCSVTDDTGYKYDLSKLTRLSKNYEVAVSNSSKKIILNVCHSLIFGYGVSCAFHSASCLVNSTNLSESGVDLGQVSKPPTIIGEGHLRIEYDSGNVCTKGDENHKKTVVDFICDHNDENIPKYVNGAEKCTYYLEWKTSLACKNFSKNEKLTGKSENLIFNNVSKSGGKEVPSIRSIVKDQINCSLTTDRGKFDLTPLILTKDNYIVKSNNSEFYINVCSPLNSAVKLDACQGKAICKIDHNKTGSILSESNLGNVGDNLSVRSDKNDRNETVRNIILHYKSASSCPENNNNSISSNITFICNYGASKGYPQFDKYSNCTYLFNWETKYVCEPVIGNFYDNCTITNGFSRTINLSVLRDKTFYVEKNKKTYSINICGVKKHCDGSTICEGNNGYGSMINVIYEYPKDSVKLAFTQGTKCLNGTFASDITFVCNSSANVESPIISLKSSSSSCYAQFEWPTKLVCISESNNSSSSSSKKPVPSNETKDKETNEVESSHGTLVVFSLTGFVIIIVTVMYLRNPSRRSRCCRTVSNPCSSTDDRVKYSRINTTEEARLLLDNCEPTTVCQSDSDDELLGA